MNSRNSKYRFVSLLLWVTQLGFSILFPICFFVLGTVWLRERLDWGAWVVVVGMLLGLACAADGLRTSIKAMIRMSGQEKEDPPPISFNNHE